MLGFLSLGIGFKGLGGLAFQGLGMWDLGVTCLGFRAQQGSQGFQSCTLKVVPLKGFPNMAYNLNHLSHCSPPRSLRRIPKPLKDRVKAPKPETL